MLVRFDEWSTCYVGSHFDIEMPAVPRKGETIRIHRSLMNPRFFDGECGERFDIREELKEFDDGYISAIVNVVQHNITPEGVIVEIDLNFDIDN